MLGSFPLFLISFAIYNMIVFITPVSWDYKLAAVPLYSGAEWAIMLGDGLIALSLIFLLFEMIKAAGASSRAVFDHMLSTLIFLAAVGEFLLVPAAATSLFATLLLISFVDVVGGWAVTMRAARRNVPFDPGSGPV
jgi:hypothetical protein